MKRRNAITAVLAATLIATPAFAQNPLDNGRGANPLDNRRGGSANPLDNAPQVPQNVRPANAPADFVSFTPQTLKDPGMDNMDAYTMLVPDGWRVNGGVRWKPTETYFAQLVMSMLGPNGEEVAFLPAQGYAFSDVDIPQQPGMPPIPAPPRPALGSRDQDGNIFLPIPSNTSEYMLNVYMPTNRPQAQNVRILEATPMNDLRQQLEQQFGPMMQHAKQMGQQVQQMAQMSGGQYQTDNGIFADLFKLQYDENGITYTELIPVAGYWQYDQSQTMDTSIDQWGNLVQRPGMRTLQQQWWVSDGKSFRAPAVQYAQTEPVMISAALSVKPTPNYQARMIELNRQIAAIRHKGAMDRLKAQAEINELNRRTNQEIFQMHQDSVRQADEARDRNHEQFIAYIRDEEISVGPNGQRFSHPAGTKLFQGPGGQVGYGPGGGTPPSGWTPVNP